jgi:Ca-activated chloride channel family protein
MNFARPDLLPLALIAPLIVAAAVWLFARRRRRVASQFSDPALMGRLGGADLLRFPAGRLALLSLAAAALGFAAAGPRWGIRSAEGQSLSLNIVIAADISKSMLAADVEPNRLERARLFSRRLLRELPGDRFGLVVFAGRAYILSPLTVDQSAIELYLDALDPNMVSQGGSSLAAAITQATDLVRGSDLAGGDRAVVLLSDGEALEEEDAVRAAAERAQRAGVKVIAIGVGTTAGANIPDIDPSTGEMLGLKRDESGEVVVSRLGEELLQDVARTTGGSYVTLADGRALTDVIAELKRLQRAEGDRTARIEPRERFAWFAGIGLLLMMIDMLLYGLPRAAPEPATPPRRARVMSGRKRRTMQTALVIFALSNTLAFGIGDLERGNRLYRAGDYEGAVAAYSKVVSAGKATPQVHYNLGTALLALGRHNEAEQHFQLALRGVDPELRERTFYNLGNRFLLEAREQGDLKAQEQLLEGAIDAYQRALRIDPADVDAKWNLEMALREKDENQQQQQSDPQQSQQDNQSNSPDDEQQQQSQGGGSGSTQSQSQSGQGNQSGSSNEERPMSQDEADRILSAIEQDERELTREKLRRGQRRVPVTRDW